MRILKICIAFSIVSCYSTVVITQTDFRQFSLDSFKLPNIDRRAMEFSGSLLGNYAKVSFEDIGRASENGRFSQQLSIGYSRFINRPDLQMTFSAHAGQSFSIQKENDGLFSDYSRETRFSPDIFYSQTRRKYTNQRFTLMEYSGSADYDYFSDRQIEPGGDSVRSRTNNFDGRLAVVLGFGKGRLEPIGDVVMALFLLQDAQDLGLALGGLNEESIYAFAGRMAEVRNRRIFDSRVMRVQELRDLYAFMLDSGWVLPNDPGFFTVLTDNWIYNTNLNRSVGKRWTYALSPMLNYENERNEIIPGGQTRIWDSSLGAQVFVEFDKRDPISLYRDHIRSHRLGADFISTTIESGVFQEKSTYMQISFDNTIGRRWYPNNRTNIFTTFYARYDYYRYLAKPSDTAQEEQHAIETGITGQASYFISYRTQMTLNARVLYGYNGGGDFLVIFSNLYGSNGKSNGFNAQVSAGLSISIF